MHRKLRLTSNRVSDLAYQQGAVRKSLLLLWRWQDLPTLAAFCSRRAVALSSRFCQISAIDVRVSHQNGKRLSDTLKLCRESKIKTKLEITDCFHFSVSMVTMHSSGCGQQSKRSKVKMFQWKRQRDISKVKHECEAPWESTLTQGCLWLEPCKNTKARCRRNMSPLVFMLKIYRT